MRAATRLRGGGAGASTASVPDLVDKDTAMQIAGVAPETPRYATFSTAFDAAASDGKVSKEALLEGLEKATKLTLDMTPEAELKFLLGDRSEGSLYDFEAVNMAGETVKLDAYKGKAVLILNVASMWGTTVRDFTAMNTLAAKYGDKLAILGFPCNQHGHQSPGNETEFMNTLKFVRPGNGFEIDQKVTLFKKIEVNGAKQHPLFKWLKTRQKVPFGPAGDSKGNGVDDNDATTQNDKFVEWAPIARGDIAWNFEKFLLGPDGTFIRRYNRYFLVDDIQPDIDAALA